MVLHTLKVTSELLFSAVEVGSALKYAICELHVNDFPNLEQQTGLAASQP